MKRKICVRSVLVAATSRANSVSVSDTPLYRVVVLIPLLVVRIVVLPMLITTSLIKHQLLLMNEVQSFGALASRPTDTPLYRNYRALACFCTSITCLSLTFSCL